MNDDSERRVLAAIRAHAGVGLLPAAAWHAGLAEAEFAARCREVGFDSGGAVPDIHGQRPMLLDPLTDLIWSARSTDQPWTRLMAGTIACAAFGARHLWQDLGAAGRPEVSGLMDRHFRALAERNVRHLKWKHHLFACLGETLGRPELRPPRCDGCEEQPICFPGEPVIVNIRRRPAGAGDIA